MTTKFSKGFNSQFAKLQSEQKQQAMDAIELFLDNPTHASLRIHSLTEEWAGWSITSSDLRVHNKLLADETVFIVGVGTHDQLYD